LPDRVSPPAAAVRRRQLAAIHCAKRDLALADDDYRDLLRRLTGARSAGDLDAQGRQKVMRHFEAAGWRPRGRRDRSPPRNLQSRGQLRKIHALLADMRKPWTYADGILAKQRPGLERVDLAPDEALKGVIAALSKQRDRERARRQ